ncbi:MAG TPA: DUF4349 domain-containing protein [Chitinophagaceae bacterium]|nr:DUF4349 domain-containing protein [Chitinophagaceae bacterium]
MKFLSQLLAAMLLWIFIACNNSAKDKPALMVKDVALSKETNKQEEFKADFTSGLVAADSTSPPQNNSPRQSPPPGIPVTKEDWDKKIIKTGNLTIEVKSYAAFNELVHNSIKKSGGYIAQEEQNQSDYKIENIVTIKVPVDQFDNAVLLLTQDGEKIVEKKITSEDVTAEIVDTKSRMEAKKRVRDRYLDLLKQAKNMEEILQVQNEVNGIQENIEAAAGRIGYLGHAAAFSTIHINFYQVLNATAINNPDPSYGYRILESFKSGLHWFAELFVILVSLWPLWAGIILAWFFIRKLKILPAKNHVQKS